MSDLKETIRRAVDDGVLTHTGRSVGDRASERVAEDVMKALPEPDLRPEVRAFIEWLVSLDDDDPASPGRRDRQTVTLQKITDRARALL